MNEKHVAIVFVAIIVLICGFMGFKHTSLFDEPLKFESLKGQMKLVDRAYAKWFGAPVDVLSSETGVRVVCDYLAYAGASANDPDLGIVPNEDWEDLRDKFNADEMDYVVETTIQSDYWASLATFDYLEAYYNDNEVLKAEIEYACAAEFPNLGEDMKREVAVFRRFGQNEGLLDSQNHILPDKRNLVKLLHRYRWVDVAGNQLPSNRLMPPEERLAFYRWQIEMSVKPFMLKIHKLDEIKQQYAYDYDYEYAKAVLYFQEGLGVDACRVLKGALEAESAISYRSNRYRGAMRTIDHTYPGACD